MSMANAFLWTDTRKDTLKSPVIFDQGAPVTSAMPLVGRSSPLSTKLQDAESKAKDADAASAVAALAAP